MIAICLRTSTPTLPLFLFCPNAPEGYRPRHGRMYILIPPGQHEGRPLQPNGTRSVRGGDGVLRRLGVRWPARHGERPSPPERCSLTGKGCVCEKE